MFRKIIAYAGGLIAVTALAGLATLVYQGSRKPDTSAGYVALGSSFAAGIGLGPRAPGSPIVCMRSINGYPQLLARKTGLTFTDMSCSGSTTGHIRDGGQVFLGPQLAAIGPATKLVTITSGGNDVAYIGDLTLAAGAGGPIGKMLWKGPKPLAERDFGKVTTNFERIVAEIRKRAPTAQVVLVSYPPVLPPEGSCPALGVAPALVDLGRQVAAALHKATHLAAERSGALFVDMAAIGAGHDACASKPWVNGASPTKGTSFHPNLAGAKATAEAVYRALGRTAPAI